MADILHLIIIRAPRERAYQALNSAAEVRNWWTRDADPDSKVGGQGEFRFAGGARVTKVRVDKLEPPGRVAWKVLAAPIPSWLDTTINFELRADSDGTTLSFAHRGFKEADDMFAYSATAWGCFLISLKEYLETGQGTPHPDDALSRVAKPN